MIDVVFGRRYRLTEKIGIGGMAEVYKATDEVLGRTVAVKIMLPHYAADPTFAARFKQEAQAAANLQSPYIVNIYDWGFETADGSTDGTYYIVMEYVRGTDLKTAIIQRGSINQRKVAEIGAQVCAALNVAHGYDIIHRDIKPHNLMIQPDGNTKVMDFGIARANDANLTQTGSVLGTAYYVSPEQAQGKPLTSATDIYSLGICLYEATTGKVPFDGSDPVSIAVKQVNQEPVPPRKINPDIDPALEAIILRAMAKDPKARFATAEQMRIALIDYLANRPSSTLVDQAARTQLISSNVAASKNEAIGMAPITGTAIMPALGSSPGTKYVRGTNGRESNNKRIALIIGILAALLVITIIIIVVINNSPNTPPPVEQVVVPTVVRMTLEETTRTLQLRGLDVGEVTYESNNNAAVDKVMRQTPAAYQRVPIGTKVDIVISTGPVRIEVPDLKNKTQEEAEALLKELNLKYTIEKRTDDVVEAGRVCAQSIVAGTMVTPDITIFVYVSTGPGDVIVPSVYGLTKTAATTLLESLGVVVIWKEDVYSDTAAPGTVVYQSISGPVKKGTIVELAISKGPEPVEVPNVIGMNYSAASLMLLSLGLIPEYSGTPPTSEQTVVSMSPGFGSEVPRNTRITLVFSTLPVTPPTPPEDPPSGTPSTPSTP